MPAGPFVLSLWVSSGVNTVEQLAQDHSAVLSSYMDDRSFFTRNWDKVTARIEAWKQWSATMGMLEAPEKLQLCVRGKDFRTILALNALPERVKQDITVLGASSVSAPRKYSELEEKRLQVAPQRAALLTGAGLSWERCLLAHQAFVLSVASYGWIGRAPTQGSCERVFNLLSKSFRSGMVASRNLRKVFYRATTHLGMTVLARAWKRMAQLRHRGLEIEWRNRPHSALGLLRRQLKEHCWVEDSPWLWRAPHPWFRSIPVKERALDLRSHSRQTQEQQAHALRMQFRREAFVRHMASNRHEAEELRNTRPQLRRAFLEVIRFLPLLSRPSGVLASHDVGLPRKPTWRDDAEQCAHQTS